MSFSDYVFVGTLSELGFKMEENYKEPYSNGTITGYTFRSKPLTTAFFQNLDQSKFIQSTVSKKNKEEINNDVRSSKIFKKCPLKIESTYYPYYNRNINTTKVKPLKNSLECKINYDYDLIKYEEDDHFNEFHYDTFKGGNVATCLIFPPSSLTGFEYVGGDLVFKIGDDEHVITTSDFKETMCVIFGRVLHKCTPVTSGTRYVFKGSISASLPEILSVNNRFTIEAIDKALSLEIIEIKYDDKIEEQNKLIEEKIEDYYKAKIDYCKKNLPQKLDDKDDFSEISDLKSLQTDYAQALRKLKTLKNLNSSHYSASYYNLNDKKYNICVLPYYIDNMNNLSSYKKGTLDYIKQLIVNGWNVTTLYETFNFKTDFEEEYRHFEGSRFYSSASGHDYEDYDGTGYNVKYALHYNISDVECGNCIDYHSEYNDQSGDDIYEEYKCSCLLVWKEQN
jgi:hypothetical protein